MRKGLDVTTLAALRRLLRDDGGATAIEYGLIAAMIAVVLISIAGTGGAVDALYNAFISAAEAMANAG